MIDAYKPSSYKSTQLQLQERDRQARAAVERGRADPPKTRTSDEGYEDRPY